MIEQVLLLGIPVHVDLYFFVNCGREVWLPQYTIPAILHVRAAPLVRVKLMVNQFRRMLPPKTLTARRPTANLTVNLTLTLTSGAALRNRQAARMRATEDCNRCQRQRQRRALLRPSRVTITPLP